MTEGVYGCAVPRAYANLNPGLTRTPDRATPCLVISDRSGEVTAAG